MYAALCTIASVAGGILGYAIGSLLYDSVGQWLINLYGYGDKVDAFRESYAKWGAIIILGKESDGSYDVGYRHGSKYPLGQANLSNMDGHATAFSALHTNGIIMEFKK